MSGIVQAQLKLPRGTALNDDPVAIRLVQALRFSVGCAVGMINDPIRRGAYVYVARYRSSYGLGSPFVYFHEPIGIVPPDRAEKYMAFSAEKPCRAYRLRHVTSYESRNPDNQQYGGGIVAGAGRWLIGTSGFPEQVDEAVDTIGCVLAEIENVDFAVRISTGNANGYLMSMLISLGLVPHDRL